MPSRMAAPVLDCVTKDFGCITSGSARRRKTHSFMDRKRREPPDGVILQVGRRSTSLADSRSTSPSGELPACTRFSTPGGSGPNLTLWQDRLNSVDQLTILTL